MTDPQYKVARRRPGQFHVSVVIGDTVNYWLLRTVQRHTGAQLRRFAITVVIGFWHEP